MSNNEGSVTENEADVHHRDIFEDPDEDPSTELVLTVAELKGIDHTELDPLYSWADGLISDLYSSPPGPESQMVVEFTYEGYRVTLYQDGQAVLMGRSTSED
jgi:hypothetical protein